MNVVAPPPRAGDGSETRTGALVVVGSGIKSVAHLTMEAKARIEWADQVLHCVADGVTDAYIRQLNPTTEDLHVYYGDGKRRRQTYEDMAERIVTHVRRGLNVCVVMYGHPGVFVHPTYRAMEILREEGFRTEMLPGVSAEDCLIADLGVDPAPHGMQTYEATEFLLHRHVIDLHVPLVLWQVGCVGDPGYDRRGFDSRNLHLLIERLVELYGAGHEVVIYEAAQHPLANPQIHVHSLPAIGPADVTGISTMFVPPLGPAPVDLAMAERLSLMERKVDDEAGAAAAAMRRRE